MQAVTLGILGLGTVGSGVVKILRQNHQILARRVGIPLHIKRIAVRDLGMAPPRGSQFAALTIPPAAAAVPPPPVSWRERLRALFVDRAAAAGESR